MSTKNSRVNPVKKKMKFDGFKFKDIYGMQTYPTYELFVHNREVQFLYQRRRQKEFFRSGGERFAE